MARKKLTTNEVIARFKNVNGDRYDYSQVVYLGSRRRVKIICRDHGEFHQYPYNHYKGNGCPVCAKTAEKKTLPETIMRFNSVHNIKRKQYSYDLVNLVNYSTNIDIVCRDHGVFQQTPNNHIRGRGCPQCKKPLMNLAESEIVCFLESMGLVVQRNSRKLIPPLELDIYIPTHKIAIEYNGLKWHTEEYERGENYHLNKTTQCAKRGIRLVHIWSDDWITNKNTQLAFIESLFRTNSQPLCASDLTISVVNWDVACLFLDKCEAGLQLTQTGIHICLVHNDKIVALGMYQVTPMGIRLHKYITSERITGGLNKITSFIQSATTSEIYTYHPKDKGDSSLYSTNNFIYEKTYKPDFTYVINAARVDKTKISLTSLKKSYPSLDLGNMYLGEALKKAKVFKLWCCGKDKYVYRES